MAIYDRFFEKHNDERHSRRSSAQVRLDRLEERVFEEEMTEALFQELKAARQAVRDESARRDEKLYGVATEGAPEPSQGPHGAMAARIRDSYLGKDPEIAALLAAVCNMARGVYGRRHNIRTVMGVDDFVQEALLLAIERLHSDARGERELPEPGAFAFRVKEDLALWQKKDKWAQSGKMATEGPCPEPGDPYTAEELRWALEDLHNPENWHDPAVVNGIKKIQHARYREALEGYHTSPKPKGSKETMSRARKALLLEVNMESPLARQGCCPAESREANRGGCVCLKDGPGTRKSVSNHGARGRIEAEGEFRGSYSYLEH